MDTCNKFKVFSCLLILCSINFILYIHFSQPSAHFDAEHKRTLFDTLSFVNSKTTQMHRVRYKSQKNIDNDKHMNGHFGEDQTTLPVFKTSFESTEKILDSSSVSESLFLTSNAAQLEQGEEGRSPYETLKDNTNVSSVLVSHQENETLCPIVPPNLNGQLATYLQAYSWEEIAKETPGLQPGGRYKPPDCQARHRVAIIIPYRNREEHLKILLRNLHPILARQQLDYGVFVIDQALPGKFNRAMLMNIGYAEAMKRYDYQCAIFHDVDLVPENDKNIYSCPEMPRHMSAAIDKFKYRLPYAWIYGGVSAVSKEHFEKMNGFSNMYFGWGGEDDDMAKRISTAGLKISRYPMDIARYKMIKHNHDTGNEQNPRRFGLLHTTATRMAVDGLNSLVYEVQKVEELPTHLRIQVLIREEDVLKKKSFVS